MRGIEKMEQFEPEEFWLRCEEGWYLLYLAACEIGDRDGKLFWGELCYDAFEMSITV